MICYCTQPSETCVCMDNSKRCTQHGDLPCEYKHLQAEQATASCFSELLSSGADSVGLLPCPFCGCTDIEISADHNSGYKTIGVHFCYCTNNACRARVFQDGDSRQQAIEAWNTRAR